MAATGPTADADLAEVYRDLHAHPELGIVAREVAGTETAVVTVGRCGRAARRTSSRTMLSCC